MQGGDEVAQIDRRYSEFLDTYMAARADGFKWRGFPGKMMLRAGMLTPADLDLRRRGLERFLFKLNEQPGMEPHMEDFLEIESC
jgi:hypothetical protein